MIGQTKSPDRFGAFFVPFFSSGEEKKGTEKREAKGISWLLLRNGIIFGFSFWHFFFSPEKKKCRKTYYSFTIFRTHFSWWTKWYPKRAFKPSVAVTAAYTGTMGRAVNRQSPKARGMHTHQTKQQS